MKEDRYVPAWIGVVGLIIIITCIFFDCYELKSMIETGLNILGTLDYVMIMLSLMFAALYFMMGFKKDAAVYYKLFIISFALETCVLVLLFRNQNIGLLIVELTSYGLLCVLASGKDVGKAGSLILCGIRILLDVAATILVIKISVSYSISSLVSKMLLSILLFVMIAAKYADKEMRGTK